MSHCLETESQPGIKLPVGTQIAAKGFECVKIQVAVFGDTQICSQPNLVPGARQIACLHGQAVRSVIGCCAAVAAKVVQGRCFDIGITGAPANGKLLAAQKAQAYNGAVGAVVFYPAAVRHGVICTIDMAKTQLCLRLYKPACVQVLSVAVFGADTVSPGIIIGFGRVAA